MPGIRNNQIELDTFGAHPLDVWEWLTPYIRPPDVPNDLGIGRDGPLTDAAGGPQAGPGEFGVVVSPDGIAVAGNTPPGRRHTWPPVQELNMAIPKVGHSVLGGFRCDAPLSPMCYPMHDHSEPTQTAQGGNYNQGLIAGMMFIGDRNAEGRLPNPGPGPASPSPTASSPSPSAVDLHRPDFEDDVANQRAVFGPDFNKSPQPPAGPQPPYDEDEAGIQPLPARCSFQR